MLTAAVSPDIRGAMPKSKFARVVEVLIWLAAVGVLAENIGLSRQNRRLKEAATPQILAATQLQMLSGVSLDGRLEPINLPPAGSRLLIITFSPGCPACRANLAGWTKLASTVGQKGIRVVWVSRDPVDITRDYCANHGIPLQNALADPPYRTWLQLQLAAVPNTVLVGPAGRVEQVWRGQLNEAGWSSVFAYFGEGQGIGSQARRTVGTVTTGCGPDLPSAPAKSCQ
jgi:peroxiredoxin